MKVYKYKWTRQFRADPQEAGAIFQQCKDDESVLEQARDPSNVLHADFDWDDTSAARAHRLHQVRTMRSSLTVQVINKKKEVTHIRAFVRTLDKTGYVPTLEASSDEMGAAEKECWRQMKALRARWKNLQFAREVVDAINDTERRALRSVRKRHA